MTLNPRLFRLGRIVEPPRATLAVLRELFGDDVDSVRVIERSWFAWWHVRALATTRRRRIYLRGAAAPFFADAKVVLHEYCHVLHQWESRRLSTGKYILELFRRGYLDNRFEIEAREFADDHHHRYRALLARREAEERARHA